MEGQPATVTLRAASAEEAGRILGRTRARGLAALVAAGYDEQEGRRLIREQRARLLPEGVATPGHRFVWIGGGDGRRIGECWFGPLAGSETDWYVFDIELAEGHRGRGYGRAAVQAVVERCRRAGARRVGLTVARDNAPALAAYRAAGFVVGREAGDSLELWQDLTA